MSCVAAASLLLPVTCAAMPVSSVRFLFDQTRGGATSRGPVALHAVHLFADGSPPQQLTIRRAHNPGGQSALEEGAHILAVAQPSPEALWIDRNMALTGDSTLELSLAGGLHELHSYEFVTGVDVRWDPLSWRLLGRDKEGLWQELDRRVRPGPPQIARGARWGPFTLRSINRGSSDSGGAEVVVERALKRERAGPVRAHEHTNGAPPSHPRPRSLLWRLLIGCAMIYLCLRCIWWRGVAESGCEVASSATTVLVASLITDVVEPATRCVGRTHATLTDTLAQLHPLLAQVIGGRTFLQHGCHVTGPRAGAVGVSPNPSPNPGRARARHQYAAVGTRSMASPTEVDETELGARI